MRCRVEAAKPDWYHAWATETEHTRRLQPPVATQTGLFLTEHWQQPRPNFVSKGFITQLDRLSEPTFFAC
jgi:hypothetical protein